MKRFAKALAILTLLLALAFVYIQAGPGVQVRIADSSVIPASERMDAFQVIMDGVKRGDFGSNQYRAPSSDRAEDFSFLTITLTAQNYNLLKAEWVQANIAPQGGDIVYLPAEPIDIAPFSKANVAVTVLVENADGNLTRMVWLDYYVYGAKKSVTAVPEQ